MIIKERNIPTLNEHTCPVCGKIFYPTAEWVYKDSYNRMYEDVECEVSTRKIYCSWHCLRADEKERKKNYHYKPIEQLTPEGVVVNVFANAYEAAAYINGEIQSVRDACRVKAKYKKYLWRYKTDGVSEVSGEDKDV